MYQHGLTHNAVFATNFPPVTYAKLQTGKINGGLAYDGTSVYAVTFDHELIALDPKTGGVRWRARGDDVMMSSPIVASGMVFVGSGTDRRLGDEPGATAWGRPGGNHWYGFRADDGRLVWSHATVGEAMPSAAFTDGALVFATGDNLATAVEAATGKVRWRTKLPGVPTMASAMVDNGKVFLVTTSGRSARYDPVRSHTTALDVRTGATLWSAPFGNADCTPTIAQGRVFVEDSSESAKGSREAVGSNDVAALDERTGKLVWRYRGSLGFFTAVGSNERAVTGMYDRGVLYQSLPTLSAMVAFRAKDGRVLWSRRTSGPVKMSAVVRGDDLYFGDSSGVFYRIDARTGSVRAAIPFDRPYTTSPPIVLGQSILVADTDYVRALPLDTFDVTRP